ncbi:UTP--glucose-1-phosphate uridylyltransferase [Trichoplax sp. H2]|nr:UTP--glucose-1-phosphate uridylyltransferase [Trichoplax sp. H2]|eukprot:RDD38426.1 UTP--glucose-1-phosphate uridylyltransferase [Trichoplax sp. H2]
MTDESALTTQSKMWNVAEFQAQAKRDSEIAMQHDLDAMLQTAPADQKEAITTTINVMIISIKGRFLNLRMGKELNGFSKLFSRYIENKGSAIKWDKIRPLPEGAVRKYDDIKVRESEVSRALLDQLVVLKLNGGLGTSMGCTGPKSIITVHTNATFLDLTIQQIEFLNDKYNASVPLVLMNSFNTHEDTLKVLRKYKSARVDIHCFNQSRYPRIYSDNLHPVASQFDDHHDCWYPPGHGDTYAAFSNSGLLEKFLAMGKRYVFISNIDNLGAVVDMCIFEHYFNRLCLNTSTAILNYLASPTDGERCDFVMEVTDKTRSDVKGGTLISYEDKLRLLEIAQVPKDHVDEFKSIKKFQIFNTNNIWIDMKAIHELYSSNALDMEIIVNNKTMDTTGAHVIQLETAIGAAIKCFNGAHGINVPRSRFLPVKKTADLLLAMSNLYTLRCGTLEMNPARSFPTVPLIKLGDEFKKVRDFLRRFEDIPDILELDHLTVSGDVTFGKNVSLKGTVIIIANFGERIDIPSGAVLENKIVTGNLRILEH